MTCAAQRSAPAARRNSLATVAAAVLADDVQVAHHANERANLHNFLPPVLRQQLLDVAKDVSLVVCGSVAAELPLAGLVIEKASDLPPVECAVMRVQPRAHLVSRVVARTGTAPPNFPLLIACMDSAGDLDNAVTNNLASLSRSQMSRTTRARVRTGIGS